MLACTSQPAGPMTHSTCSGNRLSYLRSSWSWVCADAGTFGGSVMNANIALSKFLQTLHLPSNAVNISGFYKYAPCLRHGSHTDARPWHPRDGSACLDLSS